MREHADRLKQQRAQHLPDQAPVTLNRTEDLFLRAFTWARWQLSIPPPVEG